MQYPSTSKAFTPAHWTVGKWNEEISISRDFSSTISANGRIASKKLRMLIPWNALTRGSLVNVLIRTCIPLVTVRLMMPLYQIRFCRDGVRPNGDNSAISSYLWPFVTLRISHFGLIRFPSSGWEQLGLRRMAWFKHQYCGRLRGNKLYYWNDHCRPDITEHTFRREWFIHVAPIQVIGLIHKSFVEVCSGFTNIYHISSGSSEVECRTPNRVSPGSNPPLR